VDFLRQKVKQILIVMAKMVDALAVEMNLEELEVWMEVVQLVLQNVEFVKYKNQLEHPNISSKSISVK
jgi:hypothetical protein